MLQIWFLNHQFLQLCFELDSKPAKVCFEFNLKPVVNGNARKIVRDGARDDFILNHPKSVQCGYFSNKKVNRAYIFYP